MLLREQIQYETPKELPESNALSQNGAVGPKRVKRPTLFLAAIAGSPRERGVCEVRAKSNVGMPSEFGLEVPVGAPYGRVTFAKMP